MKQTGLLGLIGYLLFGAGWLALMSIEVVGVSVLPSLAHSAPGYVNDVLAVATGGTATGDLGLFPTLNLVTGIAYLGGGLTFGVALVGLGYSLWREQRSPAGRLVSKPVSSRLDPTGAK